MRLPTWLHDNRIRALLCIAIVIATLLSYIALSVSSAQGTLLLPLDDVYIHFQYARQIALGDPYVYNPGSPPTSGATSFLYPYMLALGYSIGFQGVWLGLWALILGAVAFAASLWAIYRLCAAVEAPQWLRWWTLLTFAFTGSVAWHMMSGMETALMIAFTLWTLLTFVEKRLRGFVIAATLLALTRPEGSIMAVIASVLMVGRLWHSKDHPRRYLPLLLLPILALGVQPLVNALVTGSAVASGNQAKSILGTLPPDTATILTRIVDNFIRIWRELLRGYAPAEGWYLPPLLSIAGILAIPALLLKQDWRLVGLLLGGWFFAVTGAIATLDTAFWHFKRYQMPLLVLCFPLAAWLLTWLLSYRTSWLRYGIYAASAFMLGFAGFIGVQFGRYYVTNVSYVHQQPYQMAQWLRENTPTDATVAVHDVGMMRYLGERETLDIVGLTTPRAAVYWRNGVGSVAAFLLREQPDYIASYGRGHGYGLSLLEDTALYGEALATFTVPDWQRWQNVALAADTQGIYQPDWSQIEALTRFTPQSPYVDTEASALWSLEITDLASESAANYHWHSDDLRGFLTEVQQFDGYLGTYRRLNGYETFEIATDDLPTDESLLLVTRLRAAHAGTFDVYVNDLLVDTQWIPAAPGTWVDIATRIPEQTLSAETLHVRIVPTIGDTDGAYMPASHRLIKAPDETSFYAQPSTAPPALATYQDGTFWLAEAETTPLDAFLRVTLAMHATDTPSGDYRFFVHLYDDTTQPPVAQADSYFAADENAFGVPVGNWLSGTLRDVVALPIADLPTGTYTLAIGFYNPQRPNERLIPASDTYSVSPDGRLWLGEVEVE